jgi:hypothetical protein
MKPHDADQNVPPPFLYFDNLPAWRRQAPHATVAAGPHAPTILHKPAHKHRRSMRPYPAAAMLVVIFLMGMGAAWVCHQLRHLAGWGTPEHQINLLAHAPNSKVNNTSKGLNAAPARPAKVAPQPEKPKPAESHHAAEPAMVAGGQGVEPCKLAPQVLSADGKTPNYCIFEVHQGVSPMLNNWTTLTFFSAMALALAPAAPASAQDLNGGDLQAIKDSLEKLNAKMTSLETAFTKALTATKESIVKDTTDATTLELRTQLGSLKTSITELATEVKNLQTGLDKKSLEEFRIQLTKIEDALKKVGAEPRISNSPAPLTGRIELANTYHGEVLFIINRQPHRVGANSTLVLNAQPAGEFTYQVFVEPYGVLRSGQPMLEAGKTYKLTVRP